MSSLQQRKADRQAPMVRTALEQVSADARAGEIHEARAILRSMPERQNQARYQPLCARSYELGDPAVMWWNLPRTCDRDKAHDAGQYLATDFLKYLRSESDHSIAPKTLAFVVNGMAFNLMKALGYTWEGAAPVDIPDEVYSVIAQIGGFCDVIGTWAQAAAKRGGDSLDRHSQDQIASAISALVSGEVQA